VSVLFTIGVIAVVAAWGLAVARRLSSLREEVRLAWKRLETDQTNEAVKNVYNRHVAKYNDALETFPAYVIAPLAGFKAARKY
jgi:hypothetical protein